MNPQWPVWPKSYTDTAYRSGYRVGRCGEILALVVARIWREFLPCLNIVGTAVTYFVQHVLQRFDARQGAWYA
jgi:hypothetical protein